MRKTMVIPTYWCRRTEEAWREGDAVYDHPTPLDREGTLERTLVSMRQFKEKDFKLVILICPTSPDIEIEAYDKVLRIVKKAHLNAETYLFTPSDLKKISDVLCDAGLDNESVQLLSMFGYSNVRNICLLAASILTADAALLIDDDEVFELSDFVPRSLEFLGRRVYGDIVHGVAGYYLNSKDQYYDDVSPEPWMTYWDRFGCKARAFDQVIAGVPRLKRTPFAFGGAMILHRELFECVPFDPLVKRGEDIDYLMNSRIFGFSFFLDNTLSIKHLPQPKSHPQWKRLREDIYRFVYQRAKIESQCKIGNLVYVSPEDFDPYPGEFLKSDLDEKIYRSNMMLASQYLAEGDANSAMEAMQNIYLAKYDAPPKFDAFAAYLTAQEQWERIIRLVRQERYSVRAILEQHNISAPEIHLDTEHRRKLSQEELLAVLSKLPVFSAFTEQERAVLYDYCYVKTYYNHETVFMCGDHNEEVCLVIKGKLHLTTNRNTDSSTPPMETACLTQGQFLGENCRSHGIFRLSGTAEEFTELLCISKTKLKNLLDNHPAIGVKLLQCFLASLSEKVTHSNEEKEKAAEYDYNVAITAVF
jgi:CRP-like cAMP-binding protein